MKREIKNLALAFSAANLCLLAVWRRLILASPTDKFLTRNHTANDFFAVLLNVLVFFSVFWVVLALGQRSKRRYVQALSRWFPMLSFFFPFYILARSDPALHLQNHLLVLVGRNGVLFLVLSTALVSVYAIWRWYLRFHRVTEALLLGAAPLFLILSCQAVWYLFTTNATVNAAAKVPVRSSSREVQGPRVIWLVFDEMDQRLTFGQRPPNLQLPELDRLRSQALYASNVHSPGRETLLCLPSLISGKIATRYKAIRANELMLTFQDEKQPVLWSTQPNLFTAAREAGFSTALVGWYLPYCRVFPDMLTTCSWAAFGDPADARMNTLSGTMLHQLVSILPLSSRVDHIREYETVLEQAKKAVSDPALDLVLVHLPVPHGPAIYERRTSDFTVYADRTDWYLDNLALADKALGELRSSMESAGVWESTTVLLSADHPLRRSRTYDRKADSRVPFLLKMAKHSESVTYEATFNNIVTRDLLLAVLHGELSDPNNFAAWLQERDRMSASRQGQAGLRSEVRRLEK